MESCWWSCTLPPGKMKVRFHISRCILDSKDPSAVNVTFRKTGLLMEAVLEYSSKILWQTCFREVCGRFANLFTKICTTRFIFTKICKVPFLCTQHFSKLLILIFISRNLSFKTGRKRPRKSLESHKYL